MKSMRGCLILSESGGRGKRMKDEKRRMKDVKRRLKGEG